MTRELFIKRLCQSFGDKREDVFKFGQDHGWLDYEDELYKDDPVSRKVMARIFHMYLLKEKGVSDLTDIGEAAELRDLYDCRVCANHVAQVYLRGIMDAKDLSAKGGFMWFDLDGEDEQTVIEEYIRRIVEVVKI
jgi:hypothetical protein